MPALIMPALIILALSWPRRRGLTCRAATQAGSSLPQHGPDRGPGGST